jgi:hypothetical protein
VKKKLPFWYPPKIYWILAIFFFVWVLLGPFIDVKPSEHSRHDLFTFETVNGAMAVLFFVLVRYTKKKKSD